MLLRIKSPAGHGWIVSTGDGNRSVFLVKTTEDINDESELLAYAEAQGLELPETRIEIAVAPKEYRRLSLQGFWR